MDVKEVERIEKRLLERMETGGYAGYDPYDALLSPALARIPSKLFRLAVTQIFVYSPVNPRPLVGTRKGVNPKGLALVLSAICGLHRAGMMDRDDLIEKGDRIVNMLMDRRSEGFENDSWGFDFPWQDLTRFSPAHSPTVVVTSFVGHSLLDLHGITGERRLKESALGACRFVTEDLNRYENEHGICFSYTPLDNNVVHNASLLGTSLLARTGVRTDLAEEALNFSMNYQREEGFWPYSLDPSTGKERMQIDFHQGFVLDSIMGITEHLRLGSERIEKKLKKGVDFYFREQFEGGRSLWRWPRRWPVDIHHQAQGIITALKFFEREGEGRYLEKADEILSCTIGRFLKRDGRFSYQILPVISNGISYARWGDSWMLLAMSRYLKVLSNGE